MTVADGLVRRIEEKPGHPESSLVSTGVLHLDPSVYPYFGDGELPDAVNAAIEAGIPFRPVWAEKWDDAVYPWHLLKLNQKILHSVEGVIEGTVSRDAVITGQVMIGRNTSIHPGVLVMDDVHIGPYSSLRSAVIGEGVELSSHTAILPAKSIVDSGEDLVRAKFGAVIGDRTSSAPFTHYAGAIVGSDVRIGTGQKIEGTIPDGTLVR